VDRFRTLTAAVLVLGVTTAAPPHASLLAQAPAPARTTRTAPPSADELQAITTRGQILARYDQAGWGATDAVMALHPTEGSITHYIARQLPDGWHVVFGRLTATRDTFLVAYEARLTTGDSVFHAAALTPPRADTGYYARAARAIDTARAAFGPVQRPYNVAVIPATLDEWWVYMYPASTQQGVWPLGGDERFLVSEDGRQIRARRRMHRTIIEYAPKPGQHIRAYTHVAVLDDVPEDTDVLAALSRTPRAPEYVVSDDYVYRIDVDGTVKLMGTRRAILGGDHPHPSSPKQPSQQSPQQTSQPQHPSSHR